MFRAIILTIVVQVGFASFVYGGPFDSHLTEAVPISSITAWATTVADYSPTSEVNLASFGNSSNGLGPADHSIVSLGDLLNPAGTEGPGSITVGFQATIVDGPGADFAVFENAGSFFSNPDFVFGELAFVEVSSNGNDFARFPAASLNIEPDPNAADPNSDQLDDVFGRNFAGLNTTNVNNLAGVNQTDSGTPFDLAELATDPLVASGAVDLNDIHFVRLVDIPGDGTFTDSLGNPILDAWHSVDSGGFDLDAVGIINKVPEPTSWALMCLSALGFVSFKTLLRKHGIGNRT